MNYGNGIVGAKYQRGANIKDIAKLVRTEIKKALPNFKYSITIERFSGGQAMNIKMVTAPNGFVFAEENENYHPGGWGQDSEVWDTSKAYNKVRRTVSQIVNAYNYDDSDTQTDYFDVNFYAHFGRAWGSEADKLFDQQVAAIKAAA